MIPSQTKQDLLKGFVLHEIINMIEFFCELWQEAHSSFASTGPEIDPCVKKTARHRGAYLEFLHWRDQPGAMVYTCNPSVGETTQAPCCMLAIQVLERPDRCRCACFQSLQMDRSVRHNDAYLQSEHWREQPEEAVVHTCNPIIGDTSQAPWCMLGIPAMDRQQQILRVW